MQRLHNRRKLLLLLLLSMLFVASAEWWLVSIKLTSGTVSKQGHVFTPDDEQPTLHRSYFDGNCYLTLMKNDEGTRLRCAPSLAESSRPQCNSKRRLYVTNDNTVKFEYKSVASQPDGFYFCEGDKNLKMWTVANNHIIVHSRSLKKLWRMNIDKVEDFTDMDDAFVSIYLGSREEQKENELIIRTSLSEDQANDLITRFAHVDIQKLLPSHANLNDNTPSGSKIYFSIPVMKKGSKTLLFRWMNEKLERLSYSKGIISEARKAKQRIVTVEVSQGFATLWDGNKEIAIEETLFKGGQKTTQKTKCSVTLILNAPANIMAYYSPIEHRPRYAADQLTDSFRGNQP